MKLQKPVYIRQILGKKATIIVLGAPFNWNYAGETKAEIESKNPGISAAIAEVMREYGIKRALVPKPVFNANVVRRDALTVEMLPNFYRGADADGVILEEQGDAYFLASADCLTGVLSHPEISAIAPAHCGRNALIDRDFINQKAAPRKFQSVIDSACDCLFKMHRDLNPDWHPFVCTDPTCFCTNEVDLSAFFGAGIRPETFEHPTENHSWAKENKQMIDYLIEFEKKTDLRNRHPFPKLVTDEKKGTFSLHSLARRQFYSHSVADDPYFVNEDEFDTATSKDADGNFLFHSYRRDPKTRNLVIVKLN